MKKTSKLRFGLCCIFIKEPIKFRTAYAINLKKFTKNERIAQLSDLCLQNSQNLLLALQTVNRLKIKAFRINSKFFPLYTHPDFAYTPEKLQNWEEIHKILDEAKKYAVENNIRLSFHPDQFVILSSPREDVVKNSISELEYHARMASLTGAQVVNIHIGGKYDSKESALARFAENFKRLSNGVQKLITIENDDIIYTPSDVRKVSEKLKIPFVYDVHHHRCNSDNLSEKEATTLCVESWQKYRPEQEPYFHVSSPKTPGSREHSDYINPADIPKFWHNIKATVDIEAKAKELAIAKLFSSL